MPDVTLPARVDAVLEYRPAESSCCGARLDGVAGDSAPRWSCKACGRGCLRVLGDPVKVEAHG